MNLQALSPSNQHYLEDFLQETSQLSLPDSSLIHRFAEPQNAERLVILLPGSYIRVPYMTDFATGLAEYFPQTAVLGFDYPSRKREYTVDQIDQFRLVDYVKSVLALLSSVAGDQPVTLVGHSLGTIVTQMTLLCYAAARPQYRIDSAVILGGGPPKLSWRDYLETLPRIRTVMTVMKMVNNPAAFASSPAMAQTLGGEKRLEMLLDQGLIFPESRKVMQETFTGTDYAFIPAKFLEQHHIRPLIVGGSHDLYVTPNSIRRGFQQWGGDSLMLPVEHTDLVMGETGNQVGKQVAAWLSRGDSTAS